MNLTKSSVLCKSLSSGLGSTHLAAVILGPSGHSSSHWEFLFLCRCCWISRSARFTLSLLPSTFRIHHTTTQGGMDCHGFLHVGVTGYTITHQQKDTQNASWEPQRGRIWSFKCSLWSSLDFPTVSKMLLWSSDLHLSPKALPFSSCPHVTLFLL